MSFTLIVNSRVDRLQGFNGYDVRTIYYAGCVIGPNTRVVAYIREKVGGDGAWSASIKLTCARIEFTEASRSSNRM